MSQHRFQSKTYRFQPYEPSVSSQSISQTNSYHNDLSHNSANAVLIPTPYFPQQIQRSPNSDINSLPP